eukprot:TRINITY_DN4940_c0_g1_i1.p1 TRINITY_DN4940_c0_g1~~TRINITY_DN4940_c0_g1_i1.p1  ORF type:complete len:777 (+),score=184.20 TRINITY_DN4940_c0_g1_i1:136-2466(+)
MIIREARTRSRSKSPSRRNSNINGEEEDFVSISGEKRGSMFVRDNALISFVDDEENKANYGQKVVEEKNNNSFKHSVPTIVFTGPDEDIYSGVSSSLLASHSGSLNSDPTPRSRSNSRNNNNNFFSPPSLYQEGRRSRSSSFNKAVIPDPSSSSEDEDGSTANSPLLGSNGGHSNEKEKEAKAEKKHLAFWKIFSGDKPDIPISMQLRLSWWDKWIYYGRFPGKAVLQALVVIFCTVIVWVMNERSAFFLGNLATFYTAFWPAGYQPTVAADAPENKLYLHTVRETVTFTRNLVDAFYTWPDDSLEPYFYGPEMDSLPVTPLLVATSNETVVQRFDLNGTTYGPFGEYNNAARIFLRDMDSATIYLELWSRHDFWNRLVARQWRIEINYVVEEGTIAVSMKAYSDIKSSQVANWDRHRFVETVLFAVLIILTIVLQVLSFHSIKRAFIAVQKLKQKSAKSASVRSRIIVWSNVPLRYKIRFFNIWFIVSFLAALCLITGCVLGTLRNIGIKPDAFSDPSRLFIGIGTLLSYSGLIRYLAFDSKYTVLISALGRGLPNVIRFLISALPIFIGYALFGLLYFSTDTIRFSSFREAAITLFGLQNGDDIQNTLRSTEPHATVGTIYFFTYIFLAIYAISNIFISIIQDAYLASKEAFSVPTISNTDQNSSGQGLEEDLKAQGSLWDDLVALVEDKEHSIHDSDISMATAGGILSPLAQSASSQKIDVESDDSDDEDRIHLTMNEEIQYFMGREQRRFEKRIRKGLERITQKHTANVQNP